MARCKVLYVGLELEYKENVVILRQKAYILKLLERFGMQNCKPATTPASISQPQDKNLDNPAPSGTPYRELVGSLLYLFARHQTRYMCNSHQVVHAFRETNYKRLDAS